MSRPGPRSVRRSRDAPLTLDAPANVRAPAHLVQVYAKEAAMLDQVARFLHPALQSGEAGLVVATAAHIAGLQQRLGGLPCTFLDARQTLDAFLDDAGRVDPARFDAVVGEAVRGATRAGNGRVRAFGEMVALLAQEGRHGTAIELEALWNRLAATVPLTLLCAYPMTLFSGTQGANALAAVCAEHDQTTVPEADGTAAFGEGLLGMHQRQQAFVARIGHLALRSRDLDALFATVCPELADAIGAHTCAVLQCVPGTQEVQYRAGHGFPAGFSPRMARTPGSQPGFVLAAGGPVVYDDLANETRFTPAPRLLEQEVCSGLSVVIPTATGAWGTIGVHTRQPHAFSRDDANFLEAVAHVLGAAIDRRAAEDDLQRSRDHLEALVRERTQRLEQANRELDAFSSAVSHDLRGPVRAIAGFSTLLAQRHAGRLDPHGRELLEEVRRAVGRMGDLIEDLLDLSRADRASPTHVPVDLSAMAHEILAAEAERAPERRVACDIEPGLVVHGDPDLLRMALENLLSNAWKFTSRTAAARIVVSKRREGEDRVLCVQDNGAGFDMADAGRLFQPFQRLHRRSEYDGTGIGLATVRRIIERHGGRIWAQAKPGAGAVFYFTVPGGPGTP